MTNVNQYSKRETPDLLIRAAKAFTWSLLYLFFRLPIASVCPLKLKFSAVETSRWVIGMISVSVY